MGTGFYLVLLGFTELYWVLPSFTGFGVLVGLLFLGSAGFYRVLPGFIEFYRVLSDFIGFYRVLPGLIGFERVSASFVTANYRNSLSSTRSFLFFFLLFSRRKNQSSKGTGDS